MSAKSKHIAKVQRRNKQHEPADHGLRHPVDTKQSELRKGLPAARGPRPNTFGKLSRPTPPTVEAEPEVIACRRDDGCGETPCICQVGA